MFLYRSFPAAIFDGPSACQFPNLSGNRDGSAAAPIQASNSSRASEVNSLFMRAVPLDAANSILVPETVSATDCGNATRADGLRRPSLQKQDLRCNAVLITA